VLARMERNDEAEALMTRARAFTRGPRRARELMRGAGTFMRPEHNQGSVATLLP